MDEPRRRVDARGRRLLRGAAPRRPLPDRGRAGRLATSARRAACQLEAVRLVLELRPAADAAGLHPREHSRGLQRAGRPTPPSSTSRTCSCGCASGSRGAARSCRSTASTTSRRRPRGRTPSRRLWRPGASARRVSSGPSMPTNTSSATPGRGLQHRRLVVSHVVRGPPRRRRRDVPAADLRPGLRKRPAPAGHPRLGQPLSVDVVKMF